MDIKLLVVGKTDSALLQRLIDDYEKRLRFYVKFTWEALPNSKHAKHLTEIQQKEREGANILKKLHPTDVPVLLDERGKQYTSVGFSEYLQKKMNAGTRHLHFIIGGPYGFSDTVYRKAHDTIALSKMTFSHQMVRLFFIEQLYRAFTILNREPYHHK